MVQGQEGNIYYPNPQKPTKWGLRVFVLSESDNGYISYFESYFGKTPTESLPSSDNLLQQELFYIWSTNF